MPKLFYHKLDCTFAPKLIYNTSLRRAYLSYNKSTALVQQTSRHSNGMQEIISIFCFQGALVETDFKSRDPRVSSEIFPLGNQSIVSYTSGLRLLTHSNLKIREANSSWTVTVFGTISSILCIDHASFYWFNLQSHGYFFTG